MRILRDWSGIIFMAMLVVALLVNLADIQVLTAIFILAALLPYALCWYNFARLADAVGELPLRRGLIVATVGTTSLLLAVVEVKFVAATGWSLLGLAILVAARTILRNHLLPNGLGWITGFFGAATIVVGILSDTENDGAGPIFVVFGWALAMSVLYIGWGHPEERDTGLNPMKLHSKDRDDGSGPDL